ncbi:hypothetical protein M1L60_29465 [Actinoplanes sp. TRM 88003]|uniref:Uncharacterized protein n=1 Tax=Paractinoplanes aksuensis TaxID=2939490 RepID=A0ABT1DV83_9ACTN|nr:hypothetical protein [Actinoplanes aksuensis]MCO8274733.1 hypothetical protein [Actinoplanes aksuensis]
MNDVAIDAWQIPILVTAAIVLVEAGFNLILRYRGSRPPSQRLRTAGFGVLVLLTITVFVAALGPTRADQLSSVAAAVAAVVALWLTYRSYNATSRAREEREEAAAEPDDPGESDHG